MITADAARKLVDDFYAQELEGINAKIEENARKGIEYITLPCGEVSDYSREALIKAGFRVNDPDQRDPYYTISWHKKYDI